MLLAINHWSFPRNMTMKEVFEHCRKAGFEALELTLNAPGREGFAMASTEREILERKAMLVAEEVRP
jgi:hypothetical protein